MEKKQKKFGCVLLAAGRGTRYSSNKIKQFQNLNKKPLFIHSLEKFIDRKEVSHICLVIHPDDEAFVRKVCPKNSKVSFTHGGKTRKESVYNGLSHLKEKNLDHVYIHDSARPFITHDLLDQLNQNAINERAVIPAIPVTDTIKVVDQSNLVKNTPDRSKLMAVQTPQVFAFSDILNAHEQISATVTDDAQCCEMLGIPVKVIPGDSKNIKITYANDLKEDAVTRFQVGQGFDIHAFSNDPKRSCILGGITIPNHKGLAGHSDADVLLHALCDALLGTIGAGDIGMHFSDQDPKWKNADSRQFITYACNLVTEKKGTIVNIDLTVICETPRLATHRDAILKEISHLIPLPIDRINLKATTAEKLGFIGRQEGIAAQAVAMVQFSD